MSLAELLLILMVALLVFGPKQLPMVASHLGSLLRRLNRYKEKSKGLWQQSLYVEQLQDNTKKAAAADADYQKREAVKNENKL